MADRNKTELTLRVTEAAAQWLVNIGCKCVESEVLVAPGWLADLAGIWSPTRTEAQKHKLIPRVRYVPGMSSTRQHTEREEAYSVLPPIITVCLEVKTSGADYWNDDKWKRESPADVRILAMPRQLVASRNWPEGWWILLHSDAGGVVAVSRRAPLTLTTDTQRLFVASSLAERRHNRTAYAMWRDLARSHRNRENSDITRARIDHAIAAVVKYVREPEKSFDECLGHHIRGYKGNHIIPHWLRDQLEAIRQHPDSSKAAS